MLIATTVMAFLYAAGSAQPAGFVSPLQLQHWLLDYYRDPRPDLVVAALLALEDELPRHGSSLEAEAKRGGMRSFFGRVLAKSPATVADVERHPFAPGTRRFVAEALWRCGTTRCSAALARLGLPAAFPAPDVRGVAADSAAVIDDLWASYSATGDPEYAQRVIAALPASTTAAHPRGSAPEAALRSLVANAARDGAVLAACVAASDESEDLERRRVLEDVIARARRLRAEQPAW